MPDPAIEQALAAATPAGVEITAASPGFRDDWRPAAERLCAGFGTPDRPLAAPAVFAQPFGRQHVAVVQAVAPRPPDVRFHVLVLPRGLYAAVGDPFAVAELFPAPWDAHVVLPTLFWPDEPLPPRALDKVRRVLQEDDSASLLGAAQALVDGGRVVFERPFPAPDLLRRLWLLLPDSTRAELWPASYTFGTALPFHALVVPHADPAAFPDYLTEPQAGDYPEGRYELGLQTAADAGDQAALDTLFARRSGRQTLQLAVILLVVMMGLALAVKYL
jgi:hypothetical protein